MPTALAPYKVRTINAGFLTPENIPVVVMPRSRFVAIVDELLRDEYPGLREEILPVARTMVRFPLRTWIDKNRGCGCIVGEYLAAQPEIDRYNLAVIVRTQPDSIDTMIRNRKNGAELISFGTHIDTVLTNTLAEAGISYIDDEGVPQTSHNRYGIERVVTAIQIGEG